MNIVGTNKTYMYEKLDTNWNWYHWNESIHTYKHMSIQEDQNWYQLKEFN